MKKILWVLIGVIASPFILLIGVLLVVNLNHKPLQVTKPNSITPEGVRLAVSNYRKQQDLPELTVSQSLCGFADKREDQLTTTRQYNHDGFYALTKTDYPVGEKTIAENLAEDFFADSDVVNAWIASPTHLKNLTDSRWTDACVRIKDNVIVMIFGEPFPRQNTQTTIIEKPPLIINNTTPQMPQYIPPQQVPYPHTYQCHTNYDGTQSCY